ncbi:MAG: hypothetical protein II951_02770 [Bacteroidales bacterium]|nr:hypothetical protein [Bacteroidales bacterium]
MKTGRSRECISRETRGGRQWLAYLTFNFLYRKFGRVSDKLCRLVTYERIGWLGEKLSRYI